MANRYNIFMVGGAKCVGKTSLTTAVSSDLGLPRIETGKLLRDYRLNPPAISFKDYIATRVRENETDLLLDTHFAQYPPNTTENVIFERGLDSQQLASISEQFNILLCLLELSPKDLLKRRFKDTKRRTTLPLLVLEELEFNLRAVRLYSADLARDFFRLENRDFNETKMQIENWIRLEGYAQ